MPSIALPVSLRGQLLYSVRSVVFNPISLFAANEPGVWYDPSDLTTLFQNTAGTTPVTTAANAVALALDKSRGLALGGELVSGSWVNSVSNPFNSFSSSGVGFDATKSVSGSQQQCYIGSFSIISGRQYYFEAVVVSNTITNLNFDLSTLTTQRSNQLAVLTGSSVVTGYFTAASTQASANLRIITPSASTGSISVSSVTVRELFGIHALQSSSPSFRPAYQITPQRLNFDASDDRLNFAYNPTTSGSLAVRINGATASRVAIGSQGATDGRCFLALASDGSLGAGIGTQSTATIKGSTDIRNTWTTGIVTWDGTTVRLYQNGAEVYSGAQSGAVNTTVPFDLGCLNNNGTRSAFWSGGIGAAIALGRVMTPAEITSLHQFWSNIA